MTVTLLLARSVVNKIPSLHQLIYCLNYYIIFVSLQKRGYTRLLDLHACYHILSKDRCTGVGGDVAIFVKRHLSISEVKVNGTRLENIVVQQKKNFRILSACKYIELL